MVSVFFGHHSECPAVDLSKRDMLTSNRVLHVETAAQSDRNILRSTEEKQAEKYRSKQVDVRMRCVRAKQCFHLISVVHKLHMSQVHNMCGDGRVNV